MEHLAPLSAIGLAQQQDIFLRKGTVVFAPLWAVHRSPINWPDSPNLFKPERFLQKNISEFHDIFLPFGRGRRTCPGASLATFEIKVVLSYLILLRTCKITDNCNILPLFHYY